MKSHTCVHIIIIIQHCISHGVAMVSNKVVYASSVFVSSLLIECGRYRSRGFCSSHFHPTSKLTDNNNYYSYMTIHVRTIIIIIWGIHQISYVL